MLYRVVVSFASAEIGAHAVGEELHLTKEQAQGLIAAGYLEVVPASQRLETAEQQITAETADIKPPKRKK